MPAGGIEAVAVVAGVAAAAALITWGVWTARLARHERRMGERLTYGDVPELPPEAVSGDRQRRGAARWGGVSGSSGQPPESYATHHGSHSHDGEARNR